MDVLDIDVESRELQALDRDLRPTWQDVGMPCPVTACGSRVYTRYKHLVQHWVQIHHEFIKKFTCVQGTCVKKFINRQQLMRHLTHSHHLPVDVAKARVGVTKSSLEENSKYISPGEAQLPVAEVSTRANRFRQEAARRRRASIVVPDPQQELFSIHQSRDEEVSVMFSDNAVQVTTSVMGRGQDHTPRPVVVPEIMGQFFLE
ncbi:uncharacterized protein [Argopecten irradians]|uniref:uncharacterized protein n=1 Tax=Argopecten irradians TaxID=31199 RepID=UPI003715AAF1